MEEVEIKNDSGLTVILLPFGASIKSVFFPDKRGKLIDIVLGFNSFEGYESDPMYMGRTIGRVCNRIRNGKFSLEGVAYQLAINCKPHHIHGGPNGLSNRNWEIIRRSNTSVTFRQNLMEEEDGYPGDLKIDCTYTVNDMNQLIIEHSATTNKTTLINITNHTYWNLDGEPTIENHLLAVSAGEYLPTDENDLPTGAIGTVRGTKFDLNEKKPIKQIGEHDGSSFELDNDFVLAKSHFAEAKVRLESSQSGIAMHVCTSHPIAHIYTGNGLKTTGKHNKVYGKYAGIAIECQGYSDSPNNPNFPPIVLKANETWCKEIVFSFGHSDSREMTPIG